MTRPITGTIYYPDGTAWASGEVRARLMEPFETSTRVYPKTEITITLETDGTIPAGTQLDTPDTGTAHYLITTPDQAHYEVYIATGAAVDLATLLTIAGTAVAQDDLQTLLDAAAQVTTVEVTTTYTVLATDEVIIGSGTFPVNIPAAGNSRPPFIVINEGSGLLTATANGSDLINGASTLIIYPGQSKGFIDVRTGKWAAV